MVNTPPEGEVKLFLSKTVITSLYPKLLLGVKVICDVSCPVNVPLITPDTLPLTAIFVAFIVAPKTLMLKSNTIAASIKTSVAVSTGVLLLKAN